MACTQWIYIYIICNSNILIHTHTHTSRVYIIIRGGIYIYIIMDSVEMQSGLNGGAFYGHVFISTNHPLCGIPWPRPPSETNVLRFIIKYYLILHQILPVRSSYNRISRLRPMASFEGTKWTLPLFGFKSSQMGWLSAKNYIHIL